MVQSPEKRGTRQAISGVSKACCLICALSLERMNVLGAGSQASSTHGKVYSALSPADSKVSAMAEAVEYTLRDWGDIV